MDSPIIPRPTSIHFGEGRWIGPLPSGPEWSLPAHEERIEVNLGLGAEGYRLSVAPSGSSIIAGGEAGLAYGQSSLGQLVRAHARDGAFSIPSQVVEDSPRYAWRGLMLDVARHFFDASEVMRLIDLAASLKLNVFHWHLTDDQGWRLPVPGWPLLTEGRPAYTAAEIREVVAFAAKRQVCIVPEIDLPGHFSAVLAAYPEFGCAGKPIKLPSRPGIYFDIACAGSDGTLAFLEDVLEAVVCLFPGPFVHLGGDEAPKFAWDDCPRCRARVDAEGLAAEGGDGSEALQGWLTNRLVAFLAARGKKAVVWNDSLVAGNLEPGVVVSYWRETPERGLARAAAEAGRATVVLDYRSSYFDYPHGLTPLAKVYAGSPWLAALPESGRISVLGLEAALWTEWVLSRADIDERLFPRLAALAERAWSAEERLDYPNFLLRLDPWLARLRADGVGALTAAEADPRPSAFRAWLDVIHFFGKMLKEPRFFVFMAKSASRARRAASRVRHGHARAES